MRNGAIALVMVALAVIAAGCGGDSDTDTTATLTKAQFTKQANAICAEGEKEREVRFTEESADPSLSDSDKEDLVSNAFAEPYAETIEDLKELGAPTGGEKEFEALIAAMEKGLSKLEANPLKGLASITMFEEPDKLATEQGLDDCVV